MDTSDNCAICLRQKAAGETEHLIYRDKHWSVRHSSETNILGYLVLESRRHFLDLSEATEAELRNYGPVLGSVMQAVRLVIPCERVYTFTLAEVVPHVHAHVIPRTRALPKAFRGRGILSYPLVPGPDPNLVAETCSRLRSALNRLAVRPF